MLQSLRLADGSGHGLLPLLGWHALVALERRRQRQERAWAAKLRHLARTARGKVCKALGALQVCRQSCE